MMYNIDKKVTKHKFKTNKIKIIINDLLYIKIKLKDKFNRIFFSIYEKTNRLNTLIYIILELNIYDIQNYFIKQVHFFYNKKTYFDRLPTHIF